jgi:hypothetical protein
MVAHLCTWPRPEAVGFKVKDQKGEAMATCDMTNDCTEAVTHIGSKGYVYCAKHAVGRRHSGYGRTRAMRAWELKLVAAGEPLPSYKPISRRQAHAEQESHASL